MSGPNILTILEADEERFWSKVDIRSTDECWEWQASRQEWGHGLISIKGRHQKASRVSWTIANGPIPEGLIVRHKCDNPPCVNPEHLEVGTHADNTRDRDERGRSVYPKGVDHGNAKLTPEAVADIRSAPKYVNGTCQALADKYGVSKNYIYQVRHRSDLWKGVK